MYRSGKTKANLGYINKTRWFTTAAGGLKVTHFGWPTNMPDVCTLCNMILRSFYRNLISTYFFSTDSSLSIHTLSIPTDTGCRLIKGQQTEQLDSHTLFPYGFRVTKSLKSNHFGLLKEIKVKWKNNCRTIMLQCNSATNCCTVQLY